MAGVNYPAMGALQASPPSVRRLTLVIVAILLASFLFQWPGPRMADWKQFSFYDPGTVLKGDLLLEKGYRPTIDFGYTHGLLPLLYGRVGFAVLGRTPWAYLMLTLLTELVMAWALARIMRATAIAKSRGSGGGLVLLLIGLPMAIMPAYLTLAHPLEAMLILLALAAQAEGNKPRALATMTVCLFVKPSMAYVYGLVLVCLIAWERRGALRRILWDLVPAAIAAGILVVVLQARFGFSPVFNTLLPFTGAKSYGTSDFGFFSPATRTQFWLPAAWWQYVIGPGTVYVVASLLTAAGTGLAALVLFFQPMPRASHTSAARDGAYARSLELLFTIGLLNTAFILGFYGYPGSWHYYSYLPVLGLTLFLLLTIRPAGQKRAFIVASIFMFFSHGLMIGVSLGAWLGKTPLAAPGPGAEPGLWRYRANPGELSEYEQWAELVSIVADNQTLVMTNGYLFDLPQTIQMPDAWFPEPGIPTASEIARVKAQVRNADYVILFGHLAAEGVELWTSPEFAAERAAFQVVALPRIDQYVLLRRVTGAATKGVDGK